MKFEIKSRFDGKLLFAVEAGSLRIALELAVKHGANLSGANLDGANLDGSNLDGAKIDGCAWKKAPPCIRGSRFNVRAVGLTHIGVGCQVFTLEGWRERGNDLAARHGMTAEQVAEYRLHIEHIAAIMELYKANGWVSELPTDASAEAVAK